MGGGSSRMDLVVWHRGSPEDDGHLLVIAVRAELSQYQELLRMLRFKMGHCAPKTAAINTVPEACRACVSAFASEIWRPEELGWACRLGFSNIKSHRWVSSLLPLLFFFSNLRPARGCCINNFFSRQTLLLQAMLFSPGEHTAVLHWEWCLISSQKRRQNAMQQRDS